jgi:uncharacterized protein
MSQNPQETPDQSAGQGSAGSMPGSQTPPTSPYGQADSAAGSGSAPSPTPSSASSADPFGSPDPYGSAPGSYGSAPGSYGSPAQGPYSAPSPYGAPGQDAGSAPGGYGQQQGYSQPPPDPNYGQAQYPPAGGQQQYGSAPYDPNAAYGAAPPQGYSPQQYGQPGYPQQYAGQPGAGAPVSESDQKLWATLANISIPFFGFIGPLIVYLIYKDRDQFLKEASTEALNFSILYTAASILSSILVVAVIGAILWPLVFIAGLVFCIMAAIASNKHQLYRYPVNWRLIK